jgi:hypothetical protein
MTIASKSSRAKLPPSIPQIMRLRDADGRVVALVDMVKLAENIRRGAQLDRLLRKGAV